MFGSRLHIKMNDNQSFMERYIESDTKNIDQNGIKDVITDRFSSPIFKLKIDDFEDLFEYLSLRDLFSIRQTCEPLKKVVDYFIKKYYPSVKFDGEILRLNKDNTFFRLQQMHPTLMDFKHFSIELNDISRDEIDILKDFLPGLEQLRIRINKLRYDFYDSILKWCSSLKYLSVNQNPGRLDNAYFMFNDENGWRHRRYPTIEHFELTGGLGSPNIIPEWKTFFELNPQIRTFSVNFDASFDVPWQNFNYFLGLNIKIDLLNINHYYPHYHDLLNLLYEQGFYKRLHLYSVNITRQKDLDKIRSLHGLEKLYLGLDGKVIQPALPPLPELKELCLRGLILFQSISPNKTDYYEHMAKSLINVQRVFFDFATSDDIIPFIRYAPKVKEIKVDRLKRGRYFKEGVVNLAALNKERKELACANKITIYVSENVFLSTKMAIMKTEYSLVTLKRAYAVEWTHQWP